MDIILLSAIILGAIVLFFTEILEVELTALLVMASLMLTGILTPQEALSGFSSQATVVVAGLLIMSAAIQDTGALQIIAKKILRFSRHDPGKLVSTMMLSTGIVSMFVNNTPAVAVQLPIAMSLAEKAKLSLSKMLIPISFAAILGGTCTMIGTSTNVLVRTIAAEHKDGWEIGIFDITPLGLIFLISGLIYLFTIGRRITPDRRKDEALSERYKLREYITEIKVGENSPILGFSIDEDLRIPGIIPEEIEIIEVIRSGSILLPSDKPLIKAGDSLLVHGQLDKLMKLKNEPGFTIRHDFHLKDQDLEGRNIILVEGVLAPNSRLIGHTLQEKQFKSTFGVVALALRRHGKIIRQKIGKVRLTFGDSLLLQGDRQHIEWLKESGDFLLMEHVKLPQARSSKIAPAITIFGVTIILMSFSILPLIQAVTLGSLLMVLTGCIHLKELYASFPFKVVLLLGCLIPMGIAMEKTGAADWVARQIINAPLLEQSPHLILLVLALLTITLTEIMSNNATAVIMVPIAFALALQLGVSPKPLVLAVMFAASFSFLTPVGYQTNTIIYGPGGYRFSDFARVGAPLTFMLTILSMWLIPIFWPF